jgi:hypothetical protein
MEVFESRHSLSKQQARAASAVFTGVNATVSAKRYADGN